MLVKLDQTTDNFAIGFFSQEHLKLSGAYWCIGALKLLKKLDEKRRDEMIEFVKNCQQENGGFGGNVGHDASIPNTLYALLVLALFDAVD
jgi:geranylgeranyl transferase type-2 subunit beta